MANGTFIPHRAQQDIPGCCMLKSQSNHLYFWAIRIPVTEDDALRII
jgi:hypothetical protein